MLRIASSVLAPQCEMCQECTAADSSTAGMGDESQEPRLASDIRAL